MKTIDKYQFNENDVKQEGGIQMHVAYHTILKRYFTLKKINFEQENCEYLNKYLLQEVAILKKFNHENIYRCHKMLKTKNSFYLIYDNIQGDTLEKALQKSLTIDKKLSILRQIWEALLQLSKCGIAHLTLNPRNIIIKDDNKTILINFGHAQQIPENANFDQLKQQLHEDKYIEYLAPELLENKVYRNSDLYSYGKLVNYVLAGFISTSPSKKISFQQIVQGKQVIFYIQLAKEMLKQSSATRISISDLKEAFTNLSNIQDSQDKDSIMNKSTRSERMITSKKSMQSTRDIKTSVKRVGSTNELAKEDSKNAVEEVSVQLNASDRQKQNIIETIVRKVVKKRKFVGILLLMAKACCQNKECRYAISLNLAFLFVKKAAIAISQLAKFLKMGRSNDIVINEKTKEYFHKTTAYSKIAPIITKQMESTQSQFTSLISYIQKMPDYNSNLYIKEEICNEKLNNDYLRKCVSDFITSLSLDPQEEKGYSENELLAIYMMCLLSTYDTYEQAYENLFSQGGDTIEAEPFVKAFLSLQKRKMINLIDLDSNIKYKRFYPEQVTKCKSSRTLH